MHALAAFRPDAQRGIAVVLVLWAMTLLTVIAGSFALAMRTETMLAGNFVGAAQSEALADAGVQRALFELLKPPVDKERWKADGIPHEFTLNEGTVRVAITAESGKIDLNAASDPLLKAVLQSAEIDEDRAVALIDAIHDWRDSDNVKRAHGAEEDDYRAAGVPQVPSNVDFRTVSELQLVLGMTPQLYAKLSPLLTVFSRQAGIFAPAAPRSVLLALPGAEPALVDAFLAARDEAARAGQPAPPFAPAAAFASTQSTVFSVRAEARVRGAVFVREAVVRQSLTPKRPFAVLQWKRGRQDEPAPEEMK